MIKNSSLKLKDFKWRNFGKNDLWSDNKAQVRKTMRMVEQTDINLVFFIGKHRKRDIFELSTYDMNWVICKIGRIRRNEYLYVFRRVGEKGIPMPSMEIYQIFVDEVLKLDKKSPTNKKPVRSYPMINSGIKRQLDDLM